MLVCSLLEISTWINRNVNSLISGVIVQNLETCCLFWVVFAMAARGQLVLAKIQASLVAQMVKESACNAGDSGSITKSGRSPRESNDYPLQYSCLENSMDRGTWWGVMELQRVGHNWATNTHTQCSSRSLGSNGGEGAFTRSSFWFFIQESATRSRKSSGKLAWNSGAWTWHRAHLIQPFSFQPSSLLSFLCSWP